MIVRVLVKSELTTLNLRDDLSHFHDRIRKRYSLILLQSGKKLMVYLMKIVVTKQKEKWIIGW